MSDLLSRIPTGYTPGPWRHLPRAFGTHGVGTLRADGNWVLGARAEQLEADARLIALAHELADEVRRLSIENDKPRSGPLSASATPPAPPSTQETRN